MFRPSYISAHEFEIIDQKREINKFIGIQAILRITDFKIDSRIAENIYDLSIELSRNPISMMFLFEREFNLDDLKEKLANYNKHLNQEQLLKLFNELKENHIK
jgi:hypothetical protein